MKLIINNAMTLICRSRTKITVKYELFVEMDFQVGLPDTKGSKKNDGEGKMEQKSDRHNEESILEKTQRLNYSLPRLSASGRETKAILLQPAETLKRGIGEIVSISDELKNRLHSEHLKSSITKNKERAEGAGDRIWRERAKGIREKPTKFGSTYTSEYRQQPRYRDPLIHLRILKPLQIIDTVDASSSNQMIVVLMTSDKYSESRPALKKTRWVATQVNKVWKDKGGVTFSFYEANCKYHIYIKA